MVLNLLEFDFELGCRGKTGLAGVSEDIDILRPKVLLEIRWRVRGFEV